MQENQTTSSVPTESVPVKYAGFWIRYVAYTVDMIILQLGLILPLMLVIFFIRLVGVGDFVVGIIYNVLYIVIAFGYLILMTYYKQATLGKMLVGIVVKSDDLQNLSIKRIIMREVVGKFLSSLTFGIGYIMAAFTAKKQGLHDIISHSVVVYKDPTKKMGVGFIIAAVFAALLPVIAIFGILSSVVLVSMNKARINGKNAEIRSHLMQTAPLMEIYSTENDTYSTADDCESGAFADPAIAQAVSVLKKYNVSCTAADTSYAISAYQNEDALFCVDQTRKITTGMAAVDEEGAYCGI